MDNKKIDYSKYTKEQLIELLEISDEGAFHLRNECDALIYRLEKIKDALIETNKKIEKAMEHLTIKQARLINEKDYVITDLDLDEIMQDLESESEDNE